MLCEDNVGWTCSENGNDENCMRGVWWGTYCKTITGKTEKEMRITLR